MMKILLVDDEQLIMLSVAKMIERSNEDYELTGTASNGEEAWEFLQCNPVDIAIVDIRMPLLDGIGLLQRIQENKLSVRIIVLSAYRDFEYAQKALSYGASDYLVKPLSQKALMEALSRVSRLVKQDCTARSAVSLFSYKQMQNAIYQFLENGKADTELLPGSLKTTERGCLLLLTSPIAFPQPLIEDCSELGWEPYREMQKICFLPERLASMETIISLARKTRKLMSDYFLPSLTISCSQSDYTVSELQAALIECKLAAMYSFYLPEEEVIYYSSVHLFGPTSIRPTVSAFEKLHGYIQLGNQNAVLALLQHIYDSLKAEMGLNPQTLYQLFYEMFAEYAMLEKSPGNTGVFSGITLQSLQRYPTLDALYEYSLSLIQAYYSGVRTFPPNRDEQIVASVKEYCRANIPANVTLDDMAASVYISKSYLSSIFKERCGISIWNYFTELRIEKAKELLSSSEIKSNKICEMVGFTNPSHFGRSFRSHVGVTPIEYRQKMRKEPII